MPWLWYLMLLAVQCVGLFFTLLSLPGLWLMVGALGVYGWVTGWERYVGWPALGSVIALAVIAELIEFFSGTAGAKKAGGSRRGMVGAIVGALVGAIVFSIPIPVVGTIFGACLGAFIGASVVEMGVVGNPGHAGRVGWGAAKGTFWGIVYKLLFGLIILIVTACVAIPL